MSIFIFYDITMTALETTTPEATESMFARVFHRIDILRKHKRDLLDVLDNLEPARCVIYNIQHGSIITRSEYNLLKDFIDKKGLHTDVSSVYGGVLPSLDKEKNLTDLNDFTQLALNYPFVVDADKVKENISSQLGEGIAEIRKDKKRGLVQKEKLTGGKDVMKILFDPQNSQSGVLTFSQEEYYKYGIIEVRTSLDDPLHDTIFLQKIQIPEGTFFKELGRYRVMGNFDKDNIGFTRQRGGFFKLLFKDISEKGLKIYEIGIPFKFSSGKTFGEGFNEFNSLEVESKELGKVSLRKKYDQSGNLIGISAFKKKRFGGEEQIPFWDKDISK